jgi:transcriptional regulator with XRE-family HTH domain
MEPVVAFGHALRRLRKERGMTQEQLGLEADLRRTFISVLELGQQQPTLTTIIKIANVFGIRPSELLREAERDF